MSKDSNIAAQTAFGDAVNRGDFDAFENLVSPDCVDHDPAPGQESGPAGYRELFSQMRTAFPDLHIEVDHLVADDDNVSFAYTITGTHEGPFKGHEPTGRSVQVHAVQISRFEDDRMVERWGSTDEITLLTQMGIAPQ